MQVKITVGLGIVLACGGSVTQGAPPKPDFDNIGAYLQALQASHDPQAKAILRQIEDGPAALVREKAACERAGIPTRIVTPKIPAGQDAAPLYQQWIEYRHRAKASLPNYAEALSAGYANTPEQLAGVQSLFDAHPQMATLLDQATERPHCLFSGNAYKAVAELREGARELKARSYLLAHAGRYSDAIATQSRTFRIARHIMDQPTIINYLMARAIDAIALTGMQDTLTLAGPNAVVDKEVALTIREKRLDLSVRDALIGDVAVTLADIDKLRTASAGQFAVATSPALMADVDAPTPKLPPFTAQEHRLVNALIDASEAVYLQQTRSLIGTLGASRKSGQRPLALIQARQAALEKAAETNPCAALASQWIMSGPALVRQDDQNRAMVQVTLAAAAILAEKEKSGVFPTTLPAGFADPFTGKPLGYRREGDGFVVYSTGPDGSFDGGKPGDPWSPTKIAYRYPARPIPPPDWMLK